MKNNDFIKLNNVRLVYPSLFEPKIWEPKDGKVATPKFEATFILDKQKHAKEIYEINARTDELLVPHKISKEKLALKGYTRIPLRDPELLTNPLDAYANSLIIKATKPASSNAQPPVSLEKDGKTRVTATDRFYGGCYVNAYISLGATKQELYIVANLLAVQFVADGESIGSVSFNPEGMFEAVVDANGLTDDQIPF